MDTYNKLFDGDDDGADTWARETQYAGEPARVQAEVPAVPVAKPAQPQPVEVVPAASSEVATTAAENPYDWRKDFDEFKQYYREPQRDFAQEERLRKQRNMQLLLQGFGSLVDMGQHAAGGVVASRNVGKYTDEIDKKKDQVDAQYKADGKQYDNQMAQLAMHLREKADARKALDDKAKIAAEQRAAQLAWEEKKHADDMAYKAKVLGETERTHRAMEGLQKDKIAAKTELDKMKGSGKPYTDLVLNVNGGQKRYNLTEGEAYNIYSAMVADAAISESDTQAMMSAFGNGTAKTALLTLVNRHKDKYVPYIQQLKGELPPPMLARPKDPQGAGPLWQSPVQQPARTAKIKISSQTAQAIEGIVVSKDAPDVKRGKIAALLYDNNLTDEQVLSITNSINLK